MRDRTLVLPYQKIFILRHRFEFPCHVETLAHNIHHWIFCVNYQLDKYLIWPARAWAQCVLLLPVHTPMLPIVSLPVVLSEREHSSIWRLGTLTFLTGSSFRFHLLKLQPWKYCLIRKRQSEEHLCKSEERIFRHLEFIM